MDRPWTWKPARVKNYLTVVVCGILFGTAASAQAFGKQTTAELQDQAITVEARAIPHFEKAMPDKTRFGKLEWRGGLVLTSASSFFGGWSGLAVDPDGQLLGISDTGVWLTGRLAYDGVRPTGIIAARIGALRGFDGRPFARSTDRDSEGVVLITGNLGQGEVLVSFERNHRILRYPVTAAGLGLPTADLPLLPQMRQLSANKSLESVCQLQAGPAKGSILTFAERFPAKGPIGTGWIRPPLTETTLAPGGAAAPPAWRTLQMALIDGYDLTDCAGAPDGSLLLLERRYRLSFADPVSGSHMRIRRFAQADLLPRDVTAPLIGETLIDVVANSHEIDNMEGLGVHVDAAGATILTLISDDNFNHLLQRTVLLQFALREVEAEAVPPAAETKP